MTTAAPRDEHRAALDRLDERRVDRVAHRLLEGHDRWIEAVRLDRVRLRNDDLLGEAAIGVDTDDPKIAAEVHVPAPALGAGPVEEVRLDADEVAYLHPRDALTDADHRACQLVPQDSRRNQVVGGPVVPLEQVEVRPADTGRVDPEKHLARARFGLRPLHKLGSWSRADLCERAHRPGADGCRQEGAAKSSWTPAAVAWSASRGSSSTTAFSIAPIPSISQRMASPPTR
jgi:hypothetical protein